MSTDDQKQKLLDAVALIRQSEQLLMQASRNSTNANTSIRINTEFQNLDSILSQLLHTQAIADDADFQAATTALKQQASALQTEQAQIQKVVTDVGIAAQIAGFLAQAAAIVAKV
jgi:hypothetical protein